MARKILIIEDTPTIARVQAHIAIAIGYEADVAGSLAQAKELMAHNRYFCAIVDFVLPDAPKGEAIPFTIAKSIPTIVMTGNLDAQTREIVEQHPVIDYITKENKQAYHYLRKQLERLPRNEKVKTLVVDDSKSSRTLISALLKRHKYQVFEAGDGIEALAVLKEEPDISVIITDNEMPNMRGEELCIEIRRLYTDDDKAIIGISGVDSNSVSTRFLKNGANDYLRKPFNPEEFYCRLSQNVDTLEYIQTIRRQANTDYLTSLPNRRYFFTHVDKMLTRRAKKGQPCRLAMIDIDKFKLINDEHGHDCGDAVLQALGTAFVKHFDIALVARLGGEEFAIFFDNEEQQKCIERLEAFRLFLEKNSRSLTTQGIHFTISIGLAELVTNSIDQLITLADSKLYEAKEAGRNQLIC
ncbi:diguanylate cyclase domain-containing protein [Pseudoalteromonas sp. T1lg65]|uniref:diguanylate cyclase domain-containing protein n=1 Tax=Pseudoalteromonas sp. T1lg65 TaxID=2077101 RepID=UPI003F7966C3